VLLSMRRIFPGPYKFWFCAKALALNRVGRASRSPPDDLGKEIYL